MFILRSAKLDDLDDLFELSSKVTLLNLPNDKDLILEKLKSSQASFVTPSKDLSENFYIFALEDVSKSKVIGVSMIHAKHGTPEEPHVYLTVGYEEKYSITLNTGFTHGTLKLGFESNGYSEIGGLVVDPSYRGHEDQLGKQISFVRFLYMALYPNRFTEFIHSELMPPLNADGGSPLWDAIGNRFMNMTYNEADVLSRTNSEFIKALFPSDNIYMTLLPPEAREVVGKVGPQTLPVKKMLERVGFVYVNEIDPFDGGPHYRCKQHDIHPIKNKKNFKLSFDDKLHAEKYLITLRNDKEDFRSLFVRGTYNSQDNILFISDKYSKYVDESTHYFSIPLD